ncbi:XrtA system polysaccharide chain length determinant [Motiliproteus sp. SC1-56]|uniref:XrtA system polysaccharide chain length determinant n=1 Tax=Motiliproteus sp. SC1-56 TaxID=2799565 RepID=UPI001A8D5700|nr:XrtA system polysaccharide chain length determinant [Motiliproteus sp. SC1-56]
MQDVIDQLVVYLKGIWVSKWIVLLVAWTVCLLGWLFVLKLEDRYEASAKVHVDTQSLLAPLLRGLTIQTNPEQQVRLMVKTLFTRPNLENIARLADLDIHSNTTSEFDAFIDKLASDLSLKRAGRENIYTISYHSNSPDQAKNVVQATLTSLVENTLGDKRDDTSSAADFLDRQIAEYQRRLEAADNELKEFKKENYHLMSSNQDFYGKIQALQGRIRNIQLDLREAETRRRSLQQQIKGEIPTFGILSEGYGRPDVEVRTVYDERIKALESMLDELRLKYTDRHPDIRQGQEMLDSLIAERDAELQARLSNLGDSVSAGPSVDQNPVYQQLKISLANEETLVQSLRVRLSDYQQQLADLESKVNTIPEIEAQLKQLERGYGITQSKYNDLLSRREQARISQDADATADSFQFRIIEPPRTPTSPAGPDRPKLLSFVLISGLLAGLGGGFFASQARPVFFSSNQLQTITGFPVLGVVTLVASPDIVSKKRRHVVWFIALSAILLSAYLALMAIQFFPEINQAVINLIPDLPAELSLKSAPSPASNA